MNASGIPDYFALMDLPAGCDVDEALLERNYRALQSRLHPDRHVDSTPAERLAVLQQSSLLNDAHTTLKSPLRRAGHLLQLQGIDPERHDQSQLDPAFLFEQMELRETLEHLVAAGDIDGLERLGESGQAQLDSVWERFREVVEAGRFADAKPLFHQLQFLHKLLDDLADAEDRLLD